MRAGGADMSLRDVTIIHIGSGVTECRWRHTPEERGGFWEILKKSVSWDETCLGGRQLAFACLRRPWVGVAHVGGADEKAGIERLCLSPYVEKPLNSKVINSKVIKSFVPEQRSCKCFSCFEIPMFYVISSWTFDVCFTHSHIMAMVHNCCLYFFAYPTGPFFLFYPVSTPLTVFLWVSSSQSEPVTDFYF